jgi:hypothetical protein
MCKCKLAEKCEKACDQSFSHQHVINGLVGRRPWRDKIQPMTGNVRAEFHVICWNVVLECGARDDAMRKVHTGVGNAKFHVCAHVDSDRQR